MESQETRDIGAMIVQQGYKLSFIIVYGHSRLDRPNENFCWVYVRLSTHPPSLMFEKRVGCVDLKDIYSNKKDSFDFHGTVSFDPIKRSQQNIYQNVYQTSDTQKLVII